MTTGRAAGRQSGAGLNAAWTTDVGPRAENNEDSCLAIPDDGLFVVADGMGGEHAGELASSLAVESLPALVAKHIGQLQHHEARDVEAALCEAILELNRRVRSESSRLSGIGKMGATVAMVLVRGPMAHIAHMGDSRVYLSHPGEFERLTQDHSVVATLVRRGALSPTDAARHPMRGRLSRYVGMSGNASADVRTVEFKTGERLLLCTDGLTDVLTDGYIASLLAKHGDTQDACTALVHAAEAAGSTDNITALIVERAAP